MTDIGARSGGKHRPASPAYRRIEADLRGRITSGGWGAGAMLPSRKDLAREYGVDLGTLQRAVASLLADGTLHAAGGRGTFVAGDARTSRPSAGRTRSVAVILDQSFNPTDPGAQATPRAIYHRIRSEWDECGLLTFDTHGETPQEVVALERHALQAAAREGVAGVILWHSGGAETLPLVLRLREANVPVIFMDRYPPSLECDFVGVDDEHGAREAIDHLLRLGHRRVAFLAPQEPITTISRRLAGYERALRAAGIAPDTDLICRPPYTLSLNPESLRRHLRTAVERMARLESCPTAVFAVNDFLAFHYIAAAEQAGLSVPSDVSVIGFSDMERFSPRSPFLTTMHQPFEAMGERAADLLLARLQSAEAARSAYQHILLPTRLVVRHSCRPL